MLPALCRPRHPLTQHYVYKRSNHAERSPLAAALAAFVVRSMHLLCLHLFPGHAHTYYSCFFTQVKGPIALVQYFILAYRTDCLHLSRNLKDAHYL